MTTQTEALKLALEALKNGIAKPEEYSKAITAVKEALAQPEQEPVAWITQGGKGWLRWHKSYDDNKDSVPLYTTPPQRKPLTDEMVVAAARELNKRAAEACNVDEADSWNLYGDEYIEDARAVLEAAHGIKE